METHISSPLACRYCHHYQIQGRRGGLCHKLGAPVKGNWESCSLMTPSLSSYPTKKSYAIQLHSKQYISDIYSYEAAARLKSSTILSRTASIKKEVKAS